MGVVHEARKQLPKAKGPGGSSHMGIGKLLINVFISPKSKKRKQLSCFRLPDGRHVL